jgi:protoporphyrin/coproporphyrin ferrochelatase
MTGKESRETGKENGKPGKEKRETGKESRRAGKESREAGKSKRTAGMERRKEGKESREAGKENQETGKESRSAGKEGRETGKEGRETGKEAWVLVNVGTPDDPSTASVRRFLGEFLNDAKVIDLPWLTRKLLVNLVIVPFRAPRSAKKYRWLWTEEGSPLLYHMNELVKKVQQLAGDRADLFGAMRYGNPSLGELAEELKAAGYSRVTYLPLYPQWADSTTGSVQQVVFSRGAKNARVIDQFYDHPGFADCFAGIIRRNDPGRFDHVLFSYHGLPLRQIRKSHPEVPVEGCSCEKEMPSHGKYCYRAACYATTRLLVEKCGIAADRWSVAFQSRLSRNWMSPFTDERLVELAESGKKRVLVVPASFVADCLETTLEIAHEYGELFLKAGGEELVMTESLNSSNEWAGVVYDMLVGQTDKLTN